MNLSNETEETFFKQYCLELAKLLRTEQTEQFLHLYDSLPSEWNGSRLETAKEYIRQLQELNENEFELVYQQTFEDNNSSSIMSNLTKQTQLKRNNNNDNEQILAGNSRITSSSIIQQKQHLERTTANNLACDEKYDATSKHSSSLMRNPEESNTKTRRLQSITSNNTNESTQNNCRSHVPVDSFVQLNLIPAIDITVEDYKKTRVPMSNAKSNSANNRLSSLESMDINQSNQQRNIKQKTGSDCFALNGDNNQEYSRSSSITLSNVKDSLEKIQLPLQSNSFGHSKFITNNDLDSHGSSVATKSSSENSGSDDGHHHRSEENIYPLNSNVSVRSPTKSFSGDETVTMILNETNENRKSQHDRNLSLPEQDSYELVKLNTNEQNLHAVQLPRFKLSAPDDSNGSNNSSNDILSYTTQRSPLNNSLSSSLSSHQNRTAERHEQYNTNHSNSSRKSANRATKKRKQLQQQELIRAESIPGHRGDRDVDELVMFIDGNLSSKQQQSTSIRTSDVKLKSSSSLPDTNSNTINTTPRRKSRKPIKTFDESININENKSSQIDDDTQSISFIDDDDKMATLNTHSIDNQQNTTDNNFSNDDESHLNRNDIDSTNNSNLTNDENSLPDWTEPICNVSPVNDDIDSLSIPSTILNNSNSETTSEPFVTVTHRRRSIKERRQENNNSLRTSRTVPSSIVNDKRRFQSSSSTENANGRFINRNIQTTIKSSSLIAKEEKTKLNNDSSLLSSSSTTIPSSHPNLTSIHTISETSAPSLPSPTTSNNLTEQLSARLSSHSSTSSLPSLTKRASKLPPVVFLNKSVDVELNDVSFGFDVDNITSDKPPTLLPSSSPSAQMSTEKDIEIETPTQSIEQPTNSKSSFRRTHPQQRNNRGPMFYSGSDIRPHHHHHRNYPNPTQYIDPLFIYQYNQQRFAANYSQQLAYMNLLRTPYLSSQSPYVFIPTSYAQINKDQEQDDKTIDEENMSPSEQTQEPVVLYTSIPTQTGHMYIHPTKKLYHEPQPSIYPSQYFYANPNQHIISQDTAYFQPISPSSDIHSQQGITDDDYDDDDDEDIDYDRQPKYYDHMDSSQIMSNALQLVYSQEKRNAQTDCFNLDQLTGYLAMKWATTIDNYERGDDQIILTSE